MFRWLIRIGLAWAATRLASEFTGNKAEANEKPARGKAAPPRRKPATKARSA